MVKDDTFGKQLPLRGCEFWFDFRTGSSFFEFCVLFLFFFLKILYQSLRELGIFVRCA